MENIPRICLLSGMGMEAQCTLRVKREVFAGKAHLDADRLSFRGGLKLDVRLQDIKSARVEAGGELVLTHATGVAVLGLGRRDTAEKWALKIRYPKSLIDKLGVKPDSKVAVLGVTDPEFSRQLRERLAQATTDRLTATVDFIFYAADSEAELARLATLRKHLQPAGAIWVVSLKGAAAKIKDTDVMAAARAAGLVDNKVCGFSATHTALKLVIPRAAR